MVQYMSRIGQLQRARAFRRRLREGPRIIKVPSEVKSYVKKQISGNKEQKYNDVIQYNAQSFDNAGTLINLTSPIAQGDSDFQNREGDSIILKGLNVHYEIVRNGADDFVRVIGIQIKDENITTVAEILSYANSSNAPFGGFVKDAGNSDQFHVFYDKAFTVNDQRPTIKGKMHLGKYVKKKVYYASGGTTPIKNGIFILLIGTKASGAGTKPAFNYGARLWYQD